MGVFSKLKNIFYDEEVIEVPEDELQKIEKDVKKEAETPRIEEIKVIKTAPIEEIKEIKEEIKEEPKQEEKQVSERELFRNERKFNFTELDDDDDVLPSRRNVLNTENKTRVSEPAVSVQLETPKVFKPSPVISPIYGILDKDYTREEVVTKNESSYKELDTAATKYDSVRRKAYGTLEDDLEDTLNSMNKITPEKISEEVNKIDSSIDQLEESTSKIEDILNKIEDSTKEDVSVGELEDKLEIEHFDEDEEEEVKVEEPEDKTMTDSTLEHDLFNLIDSMYDDKEE